MPAFWQTPFRSSIVMATLKVPGNLNLFERVCHMLKLQVTKFQLHTPTSSELYLKKENKQLGEGKFAPRPK